MLRSGHLSLPPTIRLIVIGGEEALASDVVYWTEHHRGRIRLLNTYGPTEATIIVTAAELSALQDLSEGIPLGSSLPNTSVVVRHEGRRCEIGKIGQIVISGRNLARGYLKDPKATADQFRPAVDGPAGEREYWTGDLATPIAKGQLTFRGRADRLVKLHGYRTQLEEVEQAVCTHPSVAASAVLLRDDRRGGHQLVAYCVLDQKSGPLPFQPEPLNVGELRRHLRNRLPEYMVPSEFAFLDSFILNTSGKVDHTKLPEIGHLDRKRRRLPDYQAPKEGLETVLGAIWCEVLDLDVNELSVEDPFEYIGGNSLYGIEIRYKAQQRGVLFKAADMHLRQTVRGLAICCESSDGGLSRARHTLLDYVRYAKGVGTVLVRHTFESFDLGRRSNERRLCRIVGRFYDALPDQKDIIYMFFTRNLLHWVKASLAFVPDWSNIVLIGADLADDEVRWVKQRINRPFLHIDGPVELETIWDVLFQINRRHFGWLDVDCFIMNPSIFSELTIIGQDQAINCLWTHAACGPTKRPFNVFETYCGFVNIDVIRALDADGVLPRPSARMATLQQAKLLKNLIPGDSASRGYLNNVSGSAFAHRLLMFEFAPLILFQLVANASGYKLNRVRLFTELDTFNPYNYYSDEAIHVFPCIRQMDSIEWTGIDQRRRLACDYVLLTHQLGDLPEMYMARKKFLESKWDAVNVRAGEMKGLIREYLSARNVTEKTLTRPEFSWLAEDVAAS
jgi:hypothetical protein